jgi:RNA polymerase sigma factor (TIGR02999 family)
VDPLPSPPPSPPTLALTELLHRSRHGDKQAFDALLPYVHAQLESLASNCLRSARRDQTLRTTALVNEAYLKLVGAPVNFEDRSHFFAVAARAMRQILVDHARSRKRAKRGGGACQIPFDEAALVSAEPSLDVLIIDTLLNELDQIDPRKCQLIELIYFGGLTTAEAANSLGVSEPTVFRDLKFSKAWLQQRLRTTTDPD